MPGRATWRPEMGASMETETLHPFEAAGLGESPFHLVGLRQNIYSAAPGHSQPGGTCAYCGQGILYECAIRSSDGQNFTVGMDCVLKLDREDNRLVSAVKREKLKLEREKREAERQARWAESARNREIALQAERDRNGGMTDNELAQQQRDIEAAKHAERYATENGYLIDVLRSIGYSSDFVNSMIESLHRGPVSGLSERCVGILKDVYAKQHGRRGSKKYDAATQEFERRVSQ